MWVRLWDVMLVLLEHLLLLLLVQSVLILLVVVQSVLIRSHDTSGAIQLDVLLLSVVLWWRFVLLMNVLLAHHLNSIRWLLWRPLLLICAD